ncbi:hypothetical protein KAJ83_17155 [Marivibrio halodurans]|uniref:Uncharacterized protein n=1 Tax=Marivibrio halodurans TaxID=2039722 RepID=A0A8J7S4Q6_9PROT|nr:hypothetical protein [Marivibrio halodurans]MBP5858749.1 hypothetical protein [Marivibrio halodurans]
MLVPAGAAALSPFDPDRLAARGIVATARAGGVTFHALDSQAESDGTRRKKAAGAAIAHIRAALDRLRAADPAADRTIARLSGAGEVLVVHDPDFPYPALSRVTLAAFLPGGDAGIGARFLVVVGRHGAARGEAELASVLAHELAGHGLQELEGDIAGGARTLDLECEASLVEARARAALGLDTASGPIAPDSVAFRKAVEGRWCRDFRQWQARAAPDSMTLWQTRLLPAARLLDQFRAYEKTGR